MILPSIFQFSYGLLLRAAWRPHRTTRRAPTVFALGRQSGPNGVRDLSINVGTFVGGIWAFNLGGNVGISFLGGIYLNRLNADRGVLVSNSGQFIGAPVLPQLSSNTYRAGVAISYTGDNWNLTANLTGNFYDSPSSFGGSAVFGTRGPFFLSNALNLDLTATKKFDLFNEGKPKFEFGAIGYGTVNIDRNADIVGRQGRFALGALIGYDFGIFNAQLYAARDVITQANYIDAIGRRGDIPNTEAAFRIIVPLYSPAQTSTAIVRKY